MSENNGFSTKTLDCALELVRSFSIYSLTHQKDVNGTILPVDNFTVDTQSYVEFKVEVKKLLQYLKSSVALNSAMDFCSETCERKFSLKDFEEVENCVLGTIFDVPYSYHVTSEPYDALNAVIVVKEILVDIFNRLDSERAKRLCCSNKLLMNHSFTLGNNKVSFTMSESGPGFIGRDLKITVPGKNVIVEVMSPFKVTYTMTRADLFKSETVTSLYQLLLDQVLAVFINGYDLVKYFALNEDTGLFDLKLINLPSDFFDSVQRTAQRFNKDFIQSGIYQTDLDHYNELRKSNSGLKIIPPTFADQVSNSRFLVSQFSHHSDTDISFREPSTPLRGRLNMRNGDLITPVYQVQNTALVLNFAVQYVKNEYPNIVISSSAGRVIDNIEKLIKGPNVLDYQYEKSFRWHQLKIGTHAFIVSDNKLEAVLVPLTTKLFLQFDVDQNGTISTPKCVVINLNKRNVEQVPIPVSKETVSIEPLYFTPQDTTQHETRKPFNYDTFGNWEYSSINVNMLELEPTICVFIGNMLNLQTEIMRELLVD